MAWRFRCEHCGKRLQVDQDPGMNVRCPHCQNAIVVPADAQAHSPQDQAEQGQEEMVGEESTGDVIIAFMATYLPSWGTSVVLHLALGLVIMAVAHTLVPVEELPPPESTVITRPKDMVYTEDSAEKTRTIYDQVETKKSSWAYKPSQNLESSLTDNKMKDTTLFGVGAGGSNFGGLEGFGTGRGAGGGGNFFGVGGAQARDIIYIVDRSGSMADSFMFVQHELNRSISGLRRDQNFHVIFYSTGPGVEMPTRKLVPATEENKQAAYDFVNEQFVEGQTDPSDALNKAFRLRPQLIHLLTDGDFDPAIRTQVQQLNKDKRVTVNTICFLYTTGEELCMKIADDNNGSYKYVDQNWIRASGR